MFKAALLISVIFGLTGQGAVAVEGSSPVKLGKSGKAYPVKCSAPIKFTASGPASLIVDVRGLADDMGKAVEVDFTRNDKFVSKNALTLKKGKDVGKKFAGIAHVVLSVPEGVQQYALGCDATGDITMSFQVSKKAAKTNLATAEVAVEAPKATETAKADAAKAGDTAKPGEAPKPGEAGKPGEPGKPAAAAAAGGAGGPSTGAFPGLFGPTNFSPVAL